VARKERGPRNRDQFRPGNEAFDGHAWLQKSQLGPRPGQKDGGGQCVIFDRQSSGLFVNLPGRISKPRGKIGSVCSFSIRFFGFQANATGPQQSLIGCRFRI